MIDKDIFDALVTLLGDGKIEVPDIEQIRTITKVNKVSKEEKSGIEKLILLQLRYAASGYFDLGEHVVIKDAENINALISGGYVVAKKRGEENLYFISWDENVVAATPIPPADTGVIPSIPLRPADKIPNEREEGDDENTKIGDNEKSDL